jgi:hypothetical protein
MISKRNTASCRKVIILPVTLQGYETWSLTLEENMIEGSEYIDEEGKHLNLGDII